MGLPSPDTIDSVVRLFAALRHRLHHEIGHRPLVLPTKDYFPDRFTGDRASVLRLIERMQAHAGMSDVPIELELIGGEPEDGAGCGCQTTGRCNCDDKAAKSHDQGASCKTGGCRSTGGGCSSGGGCGDVLPVDPGEPRLVDLGEAWRLRLDPTEMRHPVVLTTNIARALSHVFLLETKPANAPLEPPVDVAADLLGCLLGLGGLLLAGSHIYRKSCGGPSILRLTTLGPLELAVATVLFARTEKHDVRPLRRELEATQQEALAEAERWCAARPSLPSALAHHPDRVANGQFNLAASPTSWWKRLFSGKASADDESPEMLLDRLESQILTAGSAPAGAKRPSGQKNDDDLGDLVAEALAARHGPAERTPNER